ncbi:MAG: LPS assembly protein LptD [Methyloglobulus sp.]|nr:LPS assembly protein LptD [Methyloglobulus sp.]
MYLAYFLLLFAPTIFANEANWNCQQDKKSKEWVCVGSSNSANSADKSAKPDPQLQDSQSPPVVEKTTQPSETTKASTSPNPQNQLRDNPDAVKQVAPVQPKIADAPAAIDTVEEPVEAKPVEKAPINISQPVAKQPLPAPLVKEESLPVLSASQKPLPKPLRTDTKTLPQPDGKQSGWSCDTKGKDGNWNCNLVGTDPKGEAGPVETEEHGWSLLDPAFDNKDERTFGTLRDRLKNNPWANCTMQLGTQTYAITDKKQREQSDLDVDSNFSEIYDNEIGHYEGNVDMKRADQRASANSANYDSVSETLDLHGNVFYSEDELSIATDTATLKLANEEARLRDTLFISPTMPLRGKANTVYRDSKSLSRYKDVAYTSCQPGNQDWVVHASDLKMNKETGKGAAKNAWVEFKGVPVFYSPYLSFPIDSRRNTGFLAPSYGNTTKGGFSLSAPFYWNIAPNLDATIRPRYYANRGILFAADFRYLTEMSKGQVSGEFMPNDSLYSPTDPLTTQKRYLASIKNNTRFTQNISANLDLNVVSDKYYFSELGNALSFPTFSQIRSTADVFYIDSDWSLIGRVESYQTVDPTLTGRLKPYRRLPQINFNWKHEFDSLPVATALDSEYVYFQHDDSFLPDAHRFNVRPSVSFPIKTDSAYATPKVSLQHTQYLLDKPATFSSDTNISRTLPIASLDTGLFFEKDLKFAGGSYLHTLEPRLFYLYVPRVNQKDIPIFDTSLYDFSYNSLFRENRFNGTDRIQDANQITAAITSKVIDSASGLERLKFNIGQIFYFQNREVTAPVIRVGKYFLENTVQTNTLSPLVAELGGQFNEHFAVDTAIQWDPDSNDILRGNAMLHFVNNPGELLNAGFTYRKSNLIRDALDAELAKSDAQILSDLDIPRSSLQSYRNNSRIVRGQDIVQSEFSFRWPVYDDWYAIGRWQYSFLYNKTQDAFLGLEKENCCWRFKIIGRHFTTSTLLSGSSGFNANPAATATGVTQEGIYFQIEFKGLTGLGNAGDLGDFFAKSIYGYRKSDF